MKKGRPDGPPSPWVILAAWGPCGWSPVAPGTVGTLGAIPLFWALRQLPLWAYLAATVALFLVAVPAATRAGAHWKVVDASPIVIDEVVGYLVAMAFFPWSWGTAIAGFVLFRIFDVMKPWPASALDRVKTGLGRGARRRRRRGLRGVRAGLPPARADPPPRLHRRHPLVVHGADAVTDPSAPSRRAARHRRRAPHRPDPRHQLGLAHGPALGPGRHGAPQDARGRRPGRPRRRAARDHLPLRPRRDERRPRPHRGRPHRRGGGGGHGRAARAARALARGHPGALPEARAGDDPEQRQAGPLPARRDRGPEPVRHGPGLLGAARPGGAGGAPRRPGGVPGPLGGVRPPPHRGPRRERPPPSGW